MPRVTGATMTTGSTGQVQQASFFDTDEGHHYNVASSPDQTYSVGATPALSLGDWLGRPLKIRNFTYLTSGVPVSTAFNPWDDFFNNDAVKRKIENYALIRCKLHVKFVVNAAPTYYGQFLASYRPLITHSETLPIPVLGDPSIVAYSQRPHIYLRFQQSEGGSMDLPFFFPNNWLKISQRSDFTNMGSFSIIPITDIANSNGENGNVNVSVFAWATEVEVAQTTETAALQSQEVDVSEFYPEGDEFQNAGPISGPASAVAATAGQLTGVPTIGPYARATELAAGTVAGIAKIFGYSRTPVLDVPMYVRPNPFGQMANSGTAESTDRLVVDPKQGLTVDSRTVGLDGTDELSIASICSRESYLTQFLWSEETLSGSLLWNARVTPELFSSATTIFPTPMCFAAQPFRFWKGSVTYRFQIVASQFHRGRIAIQWDPQKTPSGNMTEKVNIVATEILDLATCREFEVTIPFASDQPRLAIAHDLTTVSHGVSPVSLRSADNGVISVSVLNELTALGTSPPVYVLVSVRSHDMSFMAPRDFDEDLQVIAESQDTNVTMFFPEGEETSLSNKIDVRDEEEGAPVGDPSAEHEIVTVATPMNDSIIFGGEEILSFRPLLRRYVRNFDLKWVESETDLSLFKLSSIIPRFPICRGHDSQGISSRVGGRTNLVRLTLFNYLAGAFVGMRGGMRWKINLTGPHVFQNIEVHRSRSIRLTGNFNATETFSGLLDLAQYMNQQSTNAQTIAGFALTNARTNAGIEVELPHYATSRFYTARQDKTYKGHSFDRSDVDSMLVVGAIQDRTSSPDLFSATYYNAIGEDFNFFFFLNAPQLYLYDNSVVT